MLGRAITLSLLGLILGGGTASRAVAAPIGCQVTAALCASRKPTAQIEVVSVVGRTLEVCDRSTSPQGRVIATRGWGFGDGSSAVEACPRHTYARVGTYTITLAVEDDRSRSDVASIRVSVAVKTDAAIRAPLAPSAAPSRARVRPATVVYRIRAVRVMVPGRPAVAEDRHLGRIATAPRLIAGMSKVTPLRSGLVGALAVVAFGLLLLGVARKRQRRQGRAFEGMTTDFLSNLSHELRTPLTPVKGYAELLERHTVSTQKAREYAGAILDASGRLERVIDTLVDVAEIDAGRKQSARGPLDLTDVVAEVIGSWRSRDGGRTFRCTTSPAVTIGDRPLIALAVDQLIDNAVKFSPAGSDVDVTVRLEGTRALVTIADSGLGIAPADQKEIFGDFRQVDASSTRAYGGLGLGLSLVERVARMHSGEVTVHSAPGAGSMFTLSLPTAAARGPRAAA